MRTSRWILDSHSSLSSALSQGSAFQRHIVQLARAARRLVETFRCPERVTPSPVDDHHLGAGVKSFVSLSPIEPPWGSTANLILFGHVEPFSSVARINQLLAAE